MLDGRTAAIMAGGHTHIQMLRQHRGVWMVNPGSVGLPFREYVGGRAPTILHHAEYALVQADRDAVSVALQRVPLDRALLLEQAHDTTNPFKALLVPQYQS
jgi:hypothetical protein